MNKILILVFVLVIAWAVYYLSVVYNPDYLVRDSTPLNTNPKPSTTKSTVGSTQSSGQTTANYSIASSALDSPGSSRYFYEGWFYVDSNFPPNQKNIIFNRGGDFVVCLVGSTLNIYVNQDATKIDATNNTINVSSGEFVSVSNFPFQKWAQLVINVDGAQVDVYIDGRFVISKTSGSALNTSAATPLTYGNKYTQGKVARFRRPATSINPQQVYASYMNGSGQSSELSNENHLSVQVTKHDAVRVDKQIF